MVQKCPGQDGRNWSPEDVSEKKCPQCDYEIEFFNFDLIRSCPNCGHRVINPNFNLKCAEWCPAAELCVGENSSLYREVQTIREQMAKKIETLYKDSDRLEHIKKVTEHASEISQQKQLPPLTAIISAQLHELGAEDCNLNKLNLTDLPADREYKKGPDIARALIESLDIPTNFREEIINNIIALDKKELPNKSFAVLQEAHNRARTKKTLS
ncbi:MAG: hypothetical protein ACOCQN_04190 [Halanaerobiaceae bacterium]